MEDGALERFLFWGAAAVLAVGAVAVAAVVSGGSDEKDGDGVFKSFCDVVVNDDPDDWSVFDDIDLHFDGLEWVREVASDSVREI